MIEYGYYTKFIQNITLLDDFIYRLYPNNFPELLLPV